MERTGRSAEVRTMSNALKALAVSAAAIAAAAWWYSREPAPAPGRAAREAVAARPAVAAPAAQLLPAVFRIETSGAIGTGFFTQPDTILTNAHVVQNNLTVTIRRANG